MQLQNKLQNLEVLLIGEEWKATLLCWVMPKSKDHIFTRVYTTLDPKISLDFMIKNRVFLTHLGEVFST
jgi:hypothetical protein